VKPGRAAAAVLALALLAATMPAVAVAYTPKFGGTKSGAVLHEGTPPAHGATRASGSGRRAPHPELLRAAAASADDPLHGQPKKDAEVTAHGEAAPWVAAPHMRVRLTGDPAADAVLLKGLNTELAVAIDPDRVRAGSLADDALADDTLAHQLPRRPDIAQQRLWKFLHGHPPPLDFDLLTQALRPLRGDTLLVMGHVDSADGALVFKGAGGRPRRLPLALFEQAARDAGVQLIVVGCKSARHTSAGFVDDLNGLEAARAMARALHARPTTLFDLYNALSGPQMVMKFDPETFWATHTVEITAGPEGGVLSNLHWSGTHVRAPASAASAAAAPGPAAGEASSRWAAWWAAPALTRLAAALIVSWLGGIAAMALDGVRGKGLAALAAADAFAHVLLTPIMLTVLAESVDGGRAAWWAWGSALAAVGAAAWLGLERLSPVPSPSRATRALLALRCLMVATPLAAVALLHTGWMVWPAPAMQGLLALYGLGRPLMAPWALIGLGVLLLWAWSIVMAVVERVLHARNMSRERLGRAALWRQQLAADGVQGAAMQAAIAARLAFDKRCGTPMQWQVRWDRMETLTDVPAPDPWAGLPWRHWRLVALPLLPPQAAQGVEPQTAFGLVRVGSPFMHPLPSLLVQRWREQALHAADLPVLLARVESRLFWADFVPPGQLPRLGGVLIFGVLISASSAGIGLAFDEGARRFLQASSAVLAALFVALPGVLLLRQRWHQGWLRRVGAATSPPDARPPTAAAVD
jgi:hypothetical protein